MICPLFHIDKNLIGVCNAPLALLFTNMRVMYMCNYIGMISCPILRQVH